MEAQDSVNMEMRALSAMVTPGVRSAQRGNMHEGKWDRGEGVRGICGEWVKNEGNKVVKRVNDMCRER